MTGVISACGDSGVQVSPATRTSSLVSVPARVKAGMMTSNRDAPCDGVGGDCDRITIIVTCDAMSSNA
jgi:hypothetical protein